jgi:serine O-acetyltransferase
MLGLGTLARVLGEVRRDVGAARERDPAARGVAPAEILASWPGVHALLAHRVAHGLHEAGVPLVPRGLATASRALTGIEIHPSADIGDSFFVDHGMGVVIGETSEIGDYVTLFQGVTLGGTGKERGKRHPTLGNHVVVGAGAKILGGITIGDNVKIGANSVVLKNVAANSTVIGVPARVIRTQGERRPDATMDHSNLPDPISDRLLALEQELIELRKKLENQDPPRLL